MTHPARPAALARHEDPPAPPGCADMPPVTRPQHHRPAARRAVQARELHLTAGHHAGIDRQRARPYDGHRRQHRHGSLPASVANEARRDPHIPGTTRSWPRRHHRRRHHRQRTRPNTPRRCSGSQAVNNTPVALRDRAPHVSQALAQRVNRAMALDPADRYDSASAFGAALGSLPAVMRRWVRTDECGGHWGCWRGLADGRATVLVCAIPAGPNRYEVRGLKLPSRARIRKAARTVTQRQLPAGIRAAIKDCTSA